MSCKICVMGLGGSGNKVVELMSGEPQAGLSVVAVNTDARALEESSVPTKMQIAPAITKGFGAGGDAETGRKAVQQDIIKLTALCMDINILILVVGLGGGTGTGGAPIILDAAKQAGATTICFATLPFSFEGEQRKSQAERAIPLLSKVSDALIMIPNDRLSEFVGEIEVTESFVKVNQVLARGVSSIAKMLIQPGYINLDFSDLRRIVRSSSGISTFAYGEGEGEKRTQDALRELLNGPLVEGGDVLSSFRSLLVSIVGGEDLTLKNVSDVMESVTSSVSSSCNVSMGTVIDSGWEGRLGITVVASKKWMPSPQLEEEFSDAQEEDESEEVQESKNFHEKIDLKKKTKEVKPLKKQKKAEKMQAKLTLEAAGRDRFKGAAPTKLDGEDWDIPTYIRRGIKLGK